jgi:hypothetical protein
MNQLKQEVPSYNRRLSGNALAMICAVITVLSMTGSAIVCEMYDVGASRYRLADYEVGNAPPLQSILFRTEAMVRMPSVFDFPARRSENFARWEKGSLEIATPCACGHHRRAVASQQEATAFYDELGILPLDR